MAGRQKLHLQEPIFTTRMKAYTIVQRATIPLFDSNTKYDSGSGWPSFYDQIAEGSVTTKADNSHGMKRTEILCGQCGGHLGHIFNDGPRNKTGQRYCVNSVSLSFEPTKSTLDIPEFE